MLSLILCWFHLQGVAYTNLLCLYGLHEKYLNNMLQRNKEGLIRDLFKLVEEARKMLTYSTLFRDCLNLGEHVVPLKVLIKKPLKMLDTVNIFIVCFMSLQI